MASTAASNDSYDPSVQIFQHSPYVPIAPPFSFTDVTSAPFPSTPASSLSATSSEPSVKKIPRPRNAFMMFRSDFVSEVKKNMPDGPRQQVLSQVAALEWKHLEPCNRQVYVEMAKQEREEHRRKYPNYRFTPAPKASGRKKRGDEVVRDKEAHIKQIRASYRGVPCSFVPVTMLQEPVNIAFPPPVPSSLHEPPSMAYSPPMFFPSFGLPAHTSLNVATQSGLFVPYQPALSPSGLSSAPSSTLATPEMSGSQLQLPQVASPAQDGAGSPLIQSTTLEELSVKTPAPPVPSGPIFELSAVENASNAVSSAASLEDEHIDSSGCSGGAAEPMRGFDASGEQVIGDQPRLGPDHSAGTIEQQSFPTSSSVPYAMTADQAYNTEQTQFNDWQQLLASLTASMDSTADQSDYSQNASTTATDADFQQQQDASFMALLAAIAADNVDTALGQPPFDAFSL